MNRQITTALLSLLGVFSYAQAVTCRKGIQCGNTCISASYTCHVGGPVTPPVTTPVVQPLTSPPLPTEPSGTYFGWSLVDNSMANVVLSGRTTQSPITIGYSKRLSGLTPQEAQMKINRVLADEIQSGGVILQHQSGLNYQWLARREDGSRGVLIFLDSQSDNVTLQVSVYSASSVFDLPSFTKTTRDALLAQMAPSPISSTRTLLGTTTSLPAPTATTVPVTDGLSLTINPDNMVMDPASGKLIVTTQCQPFNFAIKPSRAFSKITLTESTNQSLSYSLDVTVDGKLRFTESSPNTYGGEIPILVGQQQAGADVKFTYTPPYSSACKGVMTIGLKVE